MKSLLQPPALVVLSAALALPIARELVVRASADQLRISAPGFDFLTGKPLERIRNGNAVAFDFQLTLFAENRTTILRRSFERFIVSYDLWEERFSVTRMRSSQSSASRLTPEAAQIWCLENLSLPVKGIEEGRPFIVRLDVRAQLGKNPPALLGDGSLSLPNLVEIFSRAGNQQGQESWRVESRQLKLTDIRTPRGAA